MFSYKVYQVQQPITVDAVSSIMLTKECTQTCTVMPGQQIAMRQMKKSAIRLCPQEALQVSNRMNSSIPKITI